MISTNIKVRDTVNTDIATVERTSKRGRESSNLPSIEALDLTRSAVKTVR